MACRTNTSRRACGRLTREPQPVAPGDGAGGERIGEDRQHDLGADAWQPAGKIMAAGDQATVHRLLRGGFVDMKRLRIVLFGKREHFFPVHALAADRATMFEIGEQIGQHLAGMQAIGQTVDDRHAGAMRDAFAMKDKLVFMNFITDQTENVWPMVKAGKGLTEMLLGSEDL